MSEFFAASLGSKPGNVLDWSQLVNARNEGIWSAPEAFLAILFAAVTCDGAMAGVEHEELLALAHRSRALKSLTPEQLAEINIKVNARLRDQDNALREACESLPQDMRLPVFAHALDLVLADGDLNAEEADFLNAIILYLGLERGGVERVADVISLKNRY
jgi:uncharacterized tellurite resistance protein B-like protein